jgi:predicted DNA binding CopG/RHH family protein
MKEYKLDTEEQDILDAFDTNEFQSEISPSRRDFIKKSALQASKKDKRINIRISSRDLIVLQRRALAEGMPYQTLLSSILHKYASGTLQDIIAANK